MLAGGGEGKDDIKQNSLAQLLYSRCRDHWEIFRGDFEDLNARVQTLEVLPQKIMVTNFKIGTKLRGQSNKGILDN